MLGRLYNGHRGLHLTLLRPHRASLDRLSCWASLHSPKSSLKSIKQQGHTIRMGFVKGTLNAEWRMDWKAARMEPEGPGK